VGSLTGVVVTVSPFATLRPFPLPMPDQALQPGGREDEETATHFRLVLRPRGDVLQPPRGIGEHAFHRWILGHHIAFGVWRMLIGLFGHMLREGPTQQSMVEAAAWYDRYSAAQLYAGSCGPQIYAVAVRPRMVAFNPAFSGVWARDYERVIALLTELNPPAYGVLRQALKRHRLVHMGLAGLLVPDGKSLLKQAGRKVSGPTTDSERDQFDAFFMIERRPVYAGPFRAHMLERLAVARCDLATHPIEFTDCAGIENLLPADVSRCLRDIAVDLIDLPRLESQCVLTNASV
jgi:L-tyrosine peroxygenase